MAATLPDIPIGQTWVDINTVSGIAVGTAIAILNKGNGEVRLIESDTIPAVDETDGLLLTTLENAYAMGSADAGSIRLWAKARGKLNSFVSVQEV